MESKLNYSAIEDYSKTFSDNLISEFFKKNEYIRGKVILEMFEVKQVNLFVLQYLFQTWKDEAEKMRSPYFDYDHEEVAGALENFMNLLSKHIRVDKENFKPLLLQAVMDTILLITSPYDFYHKRLKQNKKEKIQLAALKDSARYVKINKHLHQALIDLLEKEKETELSSEETIQYLDKVIATISAPPEDFEEYEALFSKVAPLDVSKFYEEAVNEVAETNREFTMFTVNEKFTKENKTLGDELSSTFKPGLAEIHQKKKITNINKHISINQRFMFVNELFAGDTDAFNQALEKIENLKNHDEAIEYLLKSYARPNEWVMESDEVVEFLELLDKRFA